jgi:glutathione peroxidase
MSIDNIKSFYDIPLKSADGEDNFLEQFKGKVTLVINVTGDCGNAPQYGVIEDIYQTYKHLGFEVLAVPTNDYCGPNLTYGEHVYGCENALGARKYGQENYGVTYKFSELVESNPGPGDIIPGLPSKYGKVNPHPIYLWLSKQVDAKGIDHGRQMYGNFEKYLVDRNGQLVNHYKNGALLDQNFENRQLGIIEEGIGSEPAEIEKARICAEIQKTLSE